MYAKFHHTIPLSSRDRAIFTFFRIWSSAKPRPMKNVILQSLGLDVYAKVYQNIPLNSRDRAIFTFFMSYQHFSRTGRLQNLHKLSGDKIKYRALLEIQLSVDFLRVVLELHGDLTQSYTNLQLTPKDSPGVVWYHVKCLGLDTSVRQHYKSEH